MSQNLAPGERILWQGEPVSGLRFTAQDVFAIPFTVLWLGMVVFITFGAAAVGGPDGDPLGMVILPIFLAIGLYMLIGRFIVDMIARKNTRYVLTNRRAIIETGGLRQTTRSVTLAATPEIVFREGRNGRGSVEFGGGTGGPFGMLPRNWPGAGRYMPPAFDGIEDARRVYVLALEGQRSSAA